MESEIRSTLRLAAWCAAFWTALHLGSRELAPPARRRRLAVGLALGALAARGGFAVLHAEALLPVPELLLDPGTGYSALFVPLGPLAAVPWRRGRSAVWVHLSASLGALPLALAVARLGCFAAGCCPGLPTGLPWGLRWTPGAVPVHPIALYEVAGLCALAAGLGRVTRPPRAGLALAGMGGLRLALEPLRAPAPLGSPLLSGGWIAAGWVALGLGLAARAPRAVAFPALPEVPRSAR